MTRVRFYTDVADPLGLTRHLLQQSLVRQRQVTLFLPDQLAAQTLSDGLWAGDGFLPNALADEVVAPQTPVQLAWLPEHIVQDDLLFNLQPVQPLFFGRFRHLFEIVGVDAADKQAGRQRYAFYRDRGYEIQHMNMQG
ncbi:MAG TPA: DNA polymerase III subunit chi [Methylophilus sp.]